MVLFWHKEIFWYFLCRCKLGSGPRYMICVTLFCTLRESENTRTCQNCTRLFSGSRNVQKRATKSHTSGYCLLQVVLKCFPGNAGIFLLQGPSNILRIMSLLGTNVLKNLFVTNFKRNQYIVLSHLHLMPLTRVTGLWGLPVRSSFTIDTCLYWKSIKLMCVISFPYELHNDNSIAFLDEIQG